MKRASLVDRDKLIINYLTTKDENGFFPTLEDAGMEFNLSPGHVFRIKKKHLGLNKKETNE